MLMDGNSPFLPALALPSSTFSLHSRESNFCLCFVPPGTFESDSTLIVTSKNGMMKANPNSRLKVVEKQVLSADVEAIARYSASVLERETFHFLSMLILFQLSFLLSYSIPYILETSDRRRIRPVYFGQSRRANRPEQTKEVR